VCGISGYAALDPRRTLDPAPLAAMLRCVAHRGPDDEGSFTAPGVVLGHRRLSVIDLAGGHQPLAGARPETMAVVNGEIYNYRALAAELEDHGHRFRTGSDSEVAAHAYDAWGLGCLERLDGMFALALWDGAARRLVLARDRMGEKPLYHAVADGMVIFASELSAVLAHPAVPRTLDATALSAYLAHEYVPSPGCIVAGVAKLEPGSALVLEDGQARIEHWWRLDARTSAQVLPYPEAVRELRTRLEGAVRSRLVADVPLGVFLSGGIDSSTVAALAARAGAVDTFSIGFRERSFDESAHARAVAAHIGSRHHERILEGAELPALVPELPEMLDEPLGDASILPTALLARFARERVTVALGGDGGDELFAGYPMHQARRLAPLFRHVPGPLLAGARRAAAALPVAHTNFALPFKALTFLAGAGAPPPGDHARWMASFTPEAQAALLTPETLAAAGGGAHAFAAFQRRWRESEGASPLARATHLDATTYLPDDILAKVDRASMRVALEVRAPLLAPPVVELAFGVPDRYRMRRLTGKRMLRDAVADLLPPAILARPKKGFGMPVAAWLNGPLRELVRDTLAPDALRAAGLFEPAVVARMLDDHAARRADLRKPLWTLLVFELWRRRHLAGGTP